MRTCKQRNCRAPRKDDDDDDDDDYCARHSAERWLCDHELREARDIHEVKNWLMTYVLPQAMDDIR